MEDQDTTTIETVEEQAPQLLYCSFIDAVLLLSQRIFHHLYQGPHRLWIDSLHNIDIQ